MVDTKIVPSPISVQWGRCTEPYRYLMDDFVIGYCQSLRKRDFTVKTESTVRKRKGKREYLNNADTRDLMRALNQYFDSTVEVPRNRVGKRQTIETLINEEALLLPNTSGTIRLVLDKV